MTRLSARSAASCENAKSPRQACRCKCAGLYHGSARGPARSLPADDIHAPEPKPAKAKKPAKRNHAAEAWIRRMESMKRMSGKPPG